MTQRLPNPGGDDGDWGDILNGYLGVSHASDGTLNPNTVGSSQLQSASVTSAALANNAVTTNQIASGAVTNAQLDSVTQAAVSKANTAVQTVNSLSPDGSGNVSITPASIGAGTYSKPSSGIPSADLAAAVQTDLTAATTAVQIGGDIGGTVTSPQVTTVKGGQIPVTSIAPFAITGSPTTSGQILTASLTAQSSYPSTGALDSFTRASENPLSDGGNWSVFTAWSTTPLEIVTSGQATSPAGGSASLWTANTYDDSEVYFTVTAMGASDTLAIFLRVQSAGSQTGYRLKVAPTFMQFYVLGGSSIGSTGGVTVAVGDSVGARIVGSTLTAWHKPAGGAWTLVTTVTDATYTTAGYIGVGLPGTTSSIASFGGGAVAETIAGTWSTPAGGLGNVTLSGTPSSGQIPTATSSTTATWQTINGFGAVSLSGTPSLGQVPTATGSTTATWQNPTAGTGGSGVTTFTQSGSFTLTLAEANEVAIVTPTANAAATIPTYASVAFPVGTIIGFVNNSSFTLNITPSNGVTLTSSGGTTGVAALGSFASTAILNVGTNAWIVI